MEYLRRTLLKELIMEWTCRDLNKNSFESKDHNLNLIIQSLQVKGFAKKSFKILTHLRMPLPCQIATDYLLLFFSFRNLWMKTSAIDFLGTIWNGLTLTVVLAAVTNSVWVSRPVVFHLNKARKKVCRYRKTEKNIFLD